jgi:hypothetical protein
MLDYMQDLCMSIKPRRTFSNKKVEKRRYYSTLTDAVKNQPAAKFKIKLKFNAARTKALQQQIPQTNK